MLQEFASDEGPVKCLRGGGQPPKMPLNLHDAWGGHVDVPARLERGCDLLDGT